MEKQPSYEELKEKLHHLEKELLELKSVDKNTDIHNDIYFQICNISNNAIALFETNDNGQSFIIKYFNKKALEIEQVKNNEIIGEKLSLKFPSVLTSGFLDTLKRVYKSGIPEEFPSIVISTKNISEWKHNYLYKLSENKVVSVFTDKKEIKTKEFELVEHREKLQLAMKAANYFSFEINREDFKIHTEKDIYSSLGYDDSEIKELMNKTGSLIHPDDYKIIKELIFNNNSYNKIDYEFRIKNKHANWIWFKATGKVIEWIKEDMPFRIVGLIQNIQRDKEIQIKLQESERRLKLAMESANQALIDWDIRKDNIYFSPNWYKMLGYTPNDHKLDYNFTISIAHPDDIPSAVKKLENHIKGETELFDAEVRMKSSTGEWRWILTHGKIVERNETGYPIRAIGIQTDITNIKTAEQKLIESEENFRQLADNISDAFWLRSIDHKLIYANPSCISVIGKNFKEVIEDFNAYRNWIHPNDREIYSRIRKENFKHPEQNHFYEHRIIRPDGEVRWLWLRTFPVYNNNGELYRRAGIASDITKQKKLLADLMASKVKAEESDKLKSAFLANMSHEIRTPMNGILGFTELLKDSDITTEEKCNYLKIIDSNGKQLLNLINDIIDVAKIEAHQLSISKMVKELNPLLKDIHVLFEKEQKRLKKEHIHFQLEIPENESNNIYTDISRFQQILNNLLSNALKFTDSGIIKYGYFKQNINGEFYYQFFVSDTGIGIPESTKKIIFERFGQAEPQKYKNQHGTGLGLAISKGLIDLLGGEIWFESSPEKGSTFYFTIPANGKSINQGETYSEIKSANKMKKWDNIEILIVEDDEDNLEFLKRLLIKFGANVFLARSGEEALQQIISNNSIKLVLMDIRLPDMDGFETTQKIKALKPNMPVIAQTAYAMFNDKEKCLENGCDDYISKPLDKDILFNKINNYIYN